jgi:hypothetical protein
MVARRWTQDAESGNDNSVTQRVLYCGVVGAGHIAIVLLKMDLMTRPP